ncbi:hypothetical protein LG329_03240 [Virgibacillus necropolis]|uniref:hypothetical protein n=1 Tax=Virgibacillus necropolis TaxID=163877 RepID=UPI00384E3310
MNRKTIIVWMDGKKTRISKNKNSDQNSQHPHINTEQAAAREDNKEIEPVPTYIRQNTFDEEVPLKNSKRKNTKIYKHIFVAAISAILLGVGLGIFMLNMFTNIDANAVNGKVNLQTDTSNTSNSGAAASDLSTYTLKSIQAFVLQAGLFNDESNVTVVQDKFKKAGFPTMVWKRDTQYYLFANLAETKDQTDSQKATFKELNLDTFAKKWATNEVEIELTEAEYNWIQDFHTLWNASLKDVSKNQTFSSKDWNKWIESYPDNGKNTTQFYENVQSLKTNIDKASESSAPIILLNLWNQYENFVLK